MVHVQKIERYRKGSNQKIKNSQHYHFYQQYYQQYSHLHHRAHSNLTLSPSKGQRFLSFFPFLLLLKGLSSLNPPPATRLLVLFSSVCPFKFWSLFWTPPLPPFLSLFSPASELLPSSLQIHCITKPFFNPIALLHPQRLTSP